VANWDRFNNLLKDFTFSAAQTINNNLVSTGYYPKITQWIWHQDKYGYLRIKETEVKEHSLAVFECQEIIEELDEYKALISFIRSDNALDNIMNGFEVFSDYGSTIRDKFVVLRFLEEYLTRIADNHDTVSCYNELYSDFKLALERKKLKRKVVAHLQGLISDIDEYKFKNGIMLKKFSFNDLNDTYKENFYVKGMYSRYGFFLTSIYTTPRKIFKSKPSKLKLYSTRHDVVSKMESIVNLLRLFKPGYIEIDHILDTFVNFEIDNHTRGQGKNSEEFACNPLLFNKNELNKFEKFYNNYERLKTSENKKFDNSFRWLSNISTKQNKEDRFLDYMIVLESFYLEGKQEFAYRLALRVAYTLGADFTSRIKYFRIVKKAYDLRSKMVHQGKSLPKKIEFRDKDFNKSFSKENFIDNIEEIIYLTVEKIVNEYTKFPVISSNWDKLILSG